MFVVCSTCKKKLGEKEPFENHRFVFTLCGPCHRAIATNERVARLGEYLDRFDTPVVAVSRDLGVLAANQAMSELLGKPDRESAGLLGEALHCRNAQTSEGCGSTVHCKACTIRIAVTKTLSTGEPQIRVPAYLDQKDRRLRFLISTRQYAETGIVIIEIDVFDQSDRSF